MPVLYVVRETIFEIIKKMKKQITEFGCYRMTNNYTDKICLTYNTFQKILYTVRAASHVIFSDHQKINSWRYSLENKIRKFSKTNAKRKPKKKLVVPKKTPRTNKKSCFCRYRILIQTVPKKIHFRPLAVTTREKNKWYYQFIIPRHLFLLSC